MMDDLVQLGAAPATKPEKVKQKRLPWLLVGGVVVLGAAYGCAPRAAPSNELHLSEICR